MNSVLTKIEFTCPLCEDYMKCTSPYHKSNRFDFVMAVCIHLNRHGLDLFHADVDTYISNQEALDKIILHRAMNRVFK